MLKVGIGVLVILAFFVEATAESFWVLGSYRNKTNAFAEQTRLSGLLSAEVLVVPNAVSGTFRVIVRQADIGQRELTAIDMPSWLANIDVTTEAEKGDPKAVAPALPPFEPDEGFSEYCDRVEPTPQFCDPENLALLEEKQTMLQEVSEQLTSACEQVSEEREKAICKNWKQPAESP